MNRNERHQIWLMERRALRASTTLTAYQARVLAFIPVDGETEQHTVAAQIERGTTAHEAGGATKAKVTKAFKALYSKGYLYELTWGGGYCEKNDLRMVTRIV
jgi:hypothetical protein